MKLYFLSPIITSKLCTLVNTEYLITLRKGKVLKVLKVHANTTLFVLDEKSALTKL